MPPTWIPDQDGDDIKHESPKEYYPMKIKVSDRQNKILKAIIREYVETALPVSSERIVKKFHFDISTATMRSEMVALEKKGLILQPHTSAGRTPTDKGYRYFIDYLMQDRNLSRKEQKKLTLELLKTRAANAKLFHHLTKLLAKLTGNVALTSILGEDLVFDSGLSRLLNEPEFARPESVSEMAQMVDLLDENIKILVRSEDQDLEVYIGGENPFCEAQECALMVSHFELPSGEKGIIALIGPKRMHYARNISILDYVTKFLGGATVSGIFMVGFGDQILELFS